VPVFFDIDCELENGVTIRYALNGGDPVAGTPYDTPIASETPATVNAIAQRPDWIDSDLVAKSCAVDTGDGNLAFLGIENAGGQYSLPLVVNCDKTGLPFDAAPRFMQSLGTTEIDPGAPSFFTESDFPSGGLTVDRSMTLRIAAVRSGYLITELPRQFHDMMVAAPVFPFLAGTTTLPGRSYFPRRRPELRYTVRSMARSHRRARGCSTIR
jgi:hypothetical protein